MRLFSPVPRFAILALIFAIDEAFLSILVCAETSEELAYTNTRQQSAKLKHFLIIIFFLDNRKVLFQK